MTQDLLEYRLKKHFAGIDKLITQLVIIRKYIDSAEIGISYCRDHATRGFASESLSIRPGSDLFAKNREQLLFRLKMAEKSIKKQLRESNRELACICGQQSGGRRSVK
ncbi:MAG: hypothetical protein ACOY30_05005 [Bacillota bacterium]